jgi:hypothetical protein
LGNEAFDLPSMVNDIYRIAGAWVKPTSKPDGGTAASYVTIEEDAKQKSKQDKRNKAERKKERKEKLATVAAMATNGDTKPVGKSSREGGQKVPKDLSHIQCFRCKEFGHYSTSTDCPLHEKKEGQKQGIVNSIWGSFQEYLEAGMFATMKEEEQQGSVYMTKGLLPMEVLLDNQANISIVNPRLLKNVRECDHQIKVKGVGGTQLIVHKVGDLEGFFEVYASEHTTANIICFADVEDNPRPVGGMKKKIAVSRSAAQSTEWSIRLTGAVTYKYCYCERIDL